MAKDEAESEYPFRKIRILKDGVDKEIKIRVPVKEVSSTTKGDRHG